MRQLVSQPGLLILVVAAITTLVGGVRAQEMDPGRATAIKAGMIVNFIRYTTWPESAFTDGPMKAPIVVTVVGDPAMHQALVAATAGQTFHGRRVEVRFSRYPQARSDGFISEEDLADYYSGLRGSQVVFFGTSERYRFAEALRRLDQSPVLTISDIPEFAENGGMLGFAIRNRRVAFDANEEAIRDAKLRVSSQVMRLAKIVRSRDRRSGGGR